ncbi:MAG: hypothetical protein QXR58_02345, partial [Candidatus Micrarchaeaceae archaeon]
MEDTLKKIFDAVKAVAEDTVVNFSVRDDSHIKIFDGRSESLVGAHAETAMIFAAKGKRALLTFLNEFSDSAIRSKAREIGSGLKNAPEKEDYYGIAENKGFRYPRREQNFDKKLWDSAGERIGNAVDSAVSEAMAGNAEKVHGMLSLYKSREWLKTSGGVDTYDRGTAIRLSLRVLGADGLSSQSVEAARHLSALDFKRVGKEAAQMLELASGRERIEGGLYEVLYLPLASSNLLANIGEAASISSV